MKSEGTQRTSRRDFARGLMLVGTAGLAGLRAVPAQADPPPETTKLRLFQNPVICLAPHYVAEELLYDEGFTDVRYLKNPSETQAWIPELLLSGQVDISLSFIPSDVMHIDAGAPVVILGGSHIGCIELVANNAVRSTRELKGKTVAVQRLRSDEQIFISMFVAHVGLDPQDINWIIVNHKEQPRLLAEGKIDAFMAGPPEAQELRAKGIGHVLINTTIDKPWSEYFCCVVASTREFVQKHPVATKRAIRAILKAADLCTLEPDRAARLVADRGLTSYDYALQMLKQIPYGKWREYDPEDAVRFCALWMREVGMIKSSAQRIIAEGTDWRFLNELQRELKY